MTDFKAPPELSAASDVIDITDAAVQQKLLAATVDVPTLLKLAENWNCEAKRPMPPLYKAALRASRADLIWLIIRFAKDHNATHQHP